MSDGSSGRAQGPDHSAFPIEPHPSSPGARTAIVLYARSDDVLAFSGSAVSGSLGVLTDAEQNRGKRLRRPEDQRDYLAAHLLVRLCAADVGNLAPPDVTIVQRCIICGGDHGRPFVADRPDLYVSLSHGRGFVAAAASLGPIGVDIEALDPERRGEFRIEDFAGVLAPAEGATITASADPQLAFLRSWVRKESLVKVGRVGIDAVAALDLAGLASGNGLAEVPFECWTLVDWFDSDLNLVGSVAAGSAATVVRADQRLLESSTIPRGAGYKGGMCAARWS